MNLALHLSIHFFSSALAGIIVWRLWRRPIASFVGALIGGVAIDFDHFIDYFIAFGPKFRLDYFTDGLYGLKNGKIFYLFHGWEWVALLVILSFFIGKNMNARSFVLALSFGIFLHLVIDVAVNDGMTARGYSLAYRAANGFAIEKIITPDDYSKYLARKQEIKF